MAVHQLADRRQLLGPAAGAQGQMGGDHGQRIARLAEAREQGAAPRQPPRQLVFADLEGLEAADQPETVLGDAAEVAIDLHPPVAEAGLLGELLDLIAIAAAAAAGVDLLQADDVVADEQLADTLEIVAHLLAGQHMPPAAGHVFAIAPGAHADLHVETENGQTARSVSGRHRAGRHRWANPRPQRTIGFGFTPRGMGQA